MKNQKIALFVTKKILRSCFELAVSLESWAFNPTVKGLSPLWVKISK